MSAHGYLHWLKESGGSREEIELAEIDAAIEAEEDARDYEVDEDDYETMA